LAAFPSDSALGSAPPTDPIVASAAAPASVCRSPPTENRATCHVHPTLLRLASSHRNAPLTTLDPDAPLDDLEPLHQVDGAVATDYMFKAMASIFAGTPTRADASARERYLADSVRWHLDHKPGARIVVAAYNNHIQKTPVAFDGAVASLTMGQHLQHTLGADYHAIAVTSTADHTVDMQLDARFPGRLHRRRHRTPGTRIRQCRSRRARCRPRPQLHRPARCACRPRPYPQPERLPAHPVAEAFDGVLTIPTVTVGKNIALSCVM
jgi:erythromycin esterase